MVGKTFLVSIISSIIFICILGIISNLIIGEEYFWERFIQIFFYGLITFVPLVFGGLILLNLIVRWRIKTTNNKSPNTTYIIWSIIISLLPVLGFILFDYSQRDRSFETQTLLSITEGYSIAFVLALMAIVLNKLIVWKSFNKQAN